MPIRDEATNVFMGLPGDADRLELTYNHGVDSYELGTGYGHIAVTVDDLDGTLARLAEKGIEPEKPPYQVREGGSRLCFVRDPDGYRVELIERDDLPSLADDRAHDGCVPEAVAVAIRVVALAGVEQIEAVEPGAPRADRVPGEGNDRAPVREARRAAARAPVS